MAHHSACPRVPAAKVWRLLPAKYIEALEHNQQISSCCRHPENHDVEALYSSDEDRAKGVPDIYVFHCTCGRRHTRFCLGSSEADIVTPDGVAMHVSEPRPFWDIR